MSEAYTGQRSAVGDTQERLARVLMQHWRCAWRRQPGHFWQGPASWLRGVTGDGAHQRTSGGRLIR
jgi:hypothetical protein